MLLAAWQEPWPLVNVGIVAVHTLLLLYGYWLIKWKKDRVAHPRVMKTAGVVFLVFLASFIIRILTIGVQPLGTWGFAVQPAHLQLVHAAVALVTVILVAVTYWLGFTHRFHIHRRIAPWALVLWIFTGLFGIFGHFFYPRG